jgi:hypothetical protein
MGICAVREGKVYLTTLYPFTLHEIESAMQRPLSGASAFR